MADNGETTIKVTIWWCEHCRTCRFYKDCEHAVDIGWVETVQ